VTIFSVRHSLFAITGVSLALLSWLIVGFWVDAFIQRRDAARILKSADLGGYLIDGANALATERPVIAVTANVTPADMPRCKAIGMDDFTAKPLPLKALRARISHVMSTLNQIKRPTDYSMISIDRNTVRPPRKARREPALVTPPWESESVEDAGIVERDLGNVKPGSKLAADPRSGSGDLLPPSGQTLDEQTLNRPRNLAELDASVSRLMVREVAR